MRFPYPFLKQISIAPYYFDNDGILYWADFTKITSCLHPDSIDLVVTDPPYGINYRGYRSSGLSPKNVLSENKINRTGLIKNDKRPESFELFVAFLIEIQRVLKPGGCCCCCSSSGGGSRPIFPTWISLMSRFFEYKQTIVWDKGGLGLGGHYRNNFEFILIAN